MLYPCNPAVVAWASSLLFFGCCHCFAKPAVMHCIGANPSASLLLALACARLPLIASLWLSKRSQLSGNSSFTFRPRGWVGREVSHAPHCSRTLPHFIHM